MRRVDDTDGDHHLQARLPEPRFCCSLAVLVVFGWDLSDSAVTACFFCLLFAANAYYDTHLCRLRSRDAQPSWLSDEW